MTTIPTIFRTEPCEINPAHGFAMPGQKGRAKTLCAPCYVDLCKLEICPVCRGLGIEDLVNHIKICDGRLRKQYKPLDTDGTSYTQRKKATRAKGKTGSRSKAKS
jgi:hypothetical protein